NAAHAAVFQLSPALEMPAGTTLTFRLVQSYGKQHTLGRFRLAATSATPPPRALPQPIRDILALAAAARTAEQSRDLARFYRSIAPELEEVRARVAELDRQVKAVEQQVPTTPIMRELPPDKRRETHILIKSNYLLKGEAVEPLVPA